MSTYIDKVDEPARRVLKGAGKSGSKMYISTSGDLPKGTRYTEAGKTKAHEDSAAAVKQFLVGRGIKVDESVSTMFRVVAALTKEVATDLCDMPQVVAIRENPHANGYRRGSVVDLS